MTFDEQVLVLELRITRAARKLRRLMKLAGIKLKPGRTRVKNKSSAVRLLSQPSFAKPGRKKS